MQEATSVTQRSLVRVILEEYLYKDDVTALLRDLSDYETGTKEVAIRRLLKNQFFSPSQLPRLLTKSQLANLCRQRGKDDTGDREALEARLSEVLVEEPEGRRASLRPSWWGLIHPSIRSVSEARFASGHFADSVEAALKEVNVRVKNRVRVKTGKELDGSKLMNLAFSAEDPIIALADPSNQSGRDEQQGYMLIFAGSMQAVRNPKAHANVDIDERRAVHHLILASLLMYKLDEARIP